MARNPVADIRRLVGFPERHWCVLCKPMMQAVDDDTTEIVRRVLTLRQGIYLPVGAVAEDIYRLRDVWTYAVMVTAMMSRGMSMDVVPVVGQEWLKANVECMRHIRMALANPPSGVICYVFPCLRTARLSYPAHIQVHCENIFL